MDAVACSLQSRVLCVEEKIWILILLNLNRVQVLKRKGTQVDLRKNDKSMRAGFPIALLRTCLFLTCLTGSLGLPMQTMAQQTDDPKPSDTKPSDTVPSAPDPQVPAAATPLSAITGTAKPQAVGPMNLHDRFVYAFKANFGPGAFVLPALSAGYTMAHPSDAYPREWKDGAAAYARNYGSIFGQDTTGGLAHFATAAIDGEDPRYYPSGSRNYGKRALHAIGFTFVDHGNYGGNTFALSNFVDATSAGFVGNLWEPDGFNNAAHALQRSQLQFAKLAGKNLVLEFTPELNRLFRKVRHKDNDSNPPSQRNPAPSQH
jgi:hypothetical protein